MVREDVRPAGPGFEGLPERPPKCVPSPEEWARIPASLKALNRWVVWAYLPRKATTRSPARWTKPPRSPETGLPVDAVDESAWMEAEAAYERAQADGFDGPGLAIGRPDAPEPIACVDIDHCRDPVTGVISPKALDVVRRLHSFTEISVSGEGLHIWIFGSLPRTKPTKDGRTSYSKPTEGPHVGIEFLASDHYATMSGRHLPGTPETVEHRREEVGELYNEAFAYQHLKNVATQYLALGRPDLPPPEPPGETPEPERVPEAGPLTETDLDRLAKARKGTNGARFVALFDHGAEAQADTDRKGRPCLVVRAPTGQTFTYASPSEVDYALIGELGLWLGYDPAKIEAAFLESSLGRRDKIRERPEYLRASIANLVTTKKGGTPPGRAGPKPEVTSSPPAPAKPAKPPGPEPALANGRHRPESRATSTGPRPKTPPPGPGETTRTGRATRPCSASRPSPSSWRRTNPWNGSSGASWSPASPWSWAAPRSH